MFDNIKGIGPKTAKILNKMGIYNYDDFLRIYPFRYNILMKSNLSLLNDNDPVITDGVIESIPYVVHFGKHMDKMSFKLNIGELITNITIFNRGFYKSKLEIGKIITIIGKYDQKHNNIIASEIRFEPLPDKPIIEPVYHTTYGISSKELSKYIISRLELDYNIIDYIPDYLNEKYNFIDKNSSIRIINN